MVGVGVVRLLEHGLEQTDLLGREAGAQASVLCETNDVRQVLAHEILVLVAGFVLIILVLLAMLLVLVVVQVSIVVVTARILAVLTVHVVLVVVVIRVVVVLLRFNRAREAFHATAIVVVSILVLVILILFIIGVVLAGLGIFPAFTVRFLVTSQEPRNGADARYRRLIAELVLHQSSPDLMAQNGGTLLSVVLNLGFDLWRSHSRFAPADRARLDAARLGVALKDLAHTSVAHLELPRDDTGPGTLSRHFNDAHSNVIWQRTAIDEHAS